MHRTFTLTLSGDYQNLYDLMLAVTGAVPTDGLLPKNCVALRIVAAAANDTSAVLLSDRNFANSTGLEILPAVPYEVHNDDGAIFLPDYTLKGDGLVAGVDIVYK